MNRRPVSVLVLSTGFRAGPWAVRSLEAAGFRVVGAHAAGRLAGGRSLVCPRPERYPPPTGDPDAFVDWVRSRCVDDDIDVVLPAAEDTARVLAETEPDLGRAVVAGPGREVYSALCDKGRLAATAARAGVPHPRTVIVGPQGPDEPWPSLPCIVKPRISGEDLGGAAAVVSATSVAERDAAVGALVSGGHEAVVQERITGRRWVGHCVRDADGRLDLVVSRILGDYPRIAGVASLQETVAEAPEPVATGIRRLLDAVGYRGPATISFLADGERFVVHDVNLRLGASVGVVVRSGMDMPRRAVEAALGRPAEPQPPVRPTRYARVDGEVLAAVDSLRGRGDGEAPWRVAGRVVQRGVARDGMLDPFPFDPFWLGALAAGATVGRARAIAGVARRDRLAGSDPGDPVVRA